MDHRSPEQLARWLDLSRDGLAPPDSGPEGLDPEVVEAVWALRPELLPPPRVDLDELIDEVLEGPFAPQLDMEAALAGRTEGAPTEVVEALGVLRPASLAPPRLDFDELLAEVKEGPLAAAAVLPSSLAEPAPTPAPANRRWAATLFASLAVAACALLILRPVVFRPSPDAMPVAQRAQEPLPTEVLPEAAEAQPALKSAPSKALDTGPQGPPEAERSAKQAPAPSRAPAAAPAPPAEVADDLAQAQSNADAGPRDAPAQALGGAAGSAGTLAPAPAPAAAPVLATAPAAARDEALIPEVAEEAPQVASADQGAEQEPPRLASKPARAAAPKVPSADAAAPTASTSTATAVAGRGTSPSELRAELAARSSSRSPSQSHSRAWAEAERLARSGDLDAAVALLRPLYSGSGDEPCAAAVSTATLYLRARKRSYALSDLETARSFHCSPGWEARVELELGDLYYSLGQIQQAEAAWRRGLAAAR